jgi:hypothetical protein
VAGEWLAWLFEEAAQSPAGRSRTYGDADALHRGTLLGLALAGSDRARFQAIVRAARLHPHRDSPDCSVRSLSLPDRFPALRELLVLAFPQQPHRCLRLLGRLELAMRLGEAERFPLEVLREPVGDWQPPWNSADWQALLALAPEQAATAAIYLRAREWLGESLALPPGARRALEGPQRQAEQLAYLAATAASAALTDRAATLRARLADAGSLRAAARRQVTKRLAHAARETGLAAAEDRVLACFRRRLVQVAGPLPPNLSMDDDLLNAILLTLDVSRNRRLLRRLLRAHVAGDGSWRERHPANRAFLHQLAARGVDVAVWLATVPRSYPCPSAAGGTLRLHLERAPLRILQMGNLFGTCLSRGNGGAFSTVANACELNKRVIYATDGAGRVVARQLVAINADGALVGFRVYAGLPREEDNQALQAIFRYYALAFAARCRLPLADRGPVPRLFAEDWYNDGIIPWSGTSLLPAGRGGETESARGETKPGQPSLDGCPAWIA